MNCARRLRRKFLFDYYPFSRPILIRQEVQADANQPAPLARFSRPNRTAQDLKVRHHASFQTPARCRRALTSL